MGYTTNFKGSFNIDKPLKPEHRQIIEHLNNKKHESNLMPSTYCQWVIDNEGKAVFWDGKEKFYAYEKWIAFIVSILEPLGYKINGKVFWIGEDKRDVGTIFIKNNSIKIWSSYENAQQRRKDKNAKEQIPF
jgi:hypothetical protein